MDAITQAATYILVKFGWDRLTTNAIAERAGVNVGSLYQYFPNKEAIVAELQRRHVTQTRRKLTKVLAQLPGQRSLHEALVLLVSGMVDEHRVAPAVHRVIAEELPRSVKHPPGDDGQVDELQQALLPFMENIPDPHLTIRIALVAAHAVIHTTASHQPKVLERPDFIDEVVTLLEGYLCRPLRRSAASQGTARAPRGKKTAG